MERLVDKLMKGRIPVKPGKNFKRELNFDLDNDFFKKSLFQSYKEIGPIDDESEIPIQNAKIYSKKGIEKGSQRISLELGIKENQNGLYNGRPIESKYNIGALISPKKIYGAEIDMFPEVRGSSLDLSLQTFSNSEKCQLNKDFKLAYKTLQKMDYIKPPKSIKKAPNIL